MKAQNALDLINTLDSRHQAVQPVLRKYVRKQSVSDAELDQLESPFAPLVPILRDIRDGKVSDSTRSAIDQLDTRNAVLKPLLLALAAGLE